MDFIKWNRKILIVLFISFLLAVAGCYPGNDDDDDDGGSEETTTETTTDASRTDTGTGVDANDDDDDANDDDDTSNNTGDGAGTGVEVTVNIKLSGVVASGIPCSECPVYIDEFDIETVTNENGEYAVDVDVPAEEGETADDLLPVVIESETPSGESLSNIVLENDAFVLANPITSAVVQVVIAKVEDLKESAEEGEEITLASIENIEEEVETTGSALVEVVFGKGVDYAKFSSDESFTARTDDGEGNTDASMTDVLLDVLVVVEVDLSAVAEAVAEAISDGAADADSIVTAVFEAPAADDEPVFTPILESNEGILATAAAAAVVMKDTDKVEAAFDSIFQADEDSTPEATKTFVAKAKAVVKETAAVYVDIVTTSADIDAADIDEVFLTLTTVAKTTAKEVEGTSLIESDAAEAATSFANLAKNIATIVVKQVVESVKALIASEDFQEGKFDTQDLSKNLDAAAESYSEQIDTSSIDLTEVQTEETLTAIAETVTVVVVEDKTTSFAIVDNKIMIGSENSVTVDSDGAASAVNLSVSDVKEMTPSISFQVESSNAEGLYKARLGLHIKDTGNGRSVSAILDNVELEADGNGVLMANIPENAMLNVSGVRSSGDAFIEASASGIKNDEVNGPVSTDAEGNISFNPNSLREKIEDKFEAEGTPLDITIEGGYEYTVYVQIMAPNNDAKLGTTDGEEFTEFSMRNTRDNGGAFEVGDASIRSGSAYMLKGTYTVE